jgi:hypothetical protein
MEMGWWMPLDNNHFSAPMVGLGQFQHISLMEPRRSGECSYEFVDVEDRTTKAKHLSQATIGSSRTKVTISEKQPIIPSPTIPLPT